MADHEPDLTEEQRIFFEWMRQCEVQQLSPMLMLAAETAGHDGHQDLNINRAHLFVTSDLPRELLQMVLMSIAERLDEPDTSVEIRPLP